MLLLNLPTNETGVLGLIALMAFVAFCFGSAIVVGVLYANGIAMKVQIGLKDALHEIKDELKTEVQELSAFAKDVSTNLSRIAENATATSLEFQKFKETHELTHKSEQTLLYERLRPYLSEQGKSQKNVLKLKHKVQILDERLRDLASNGSGQYVEKKNYEPLFTELTIKQDED